MNRNTAPKSVIDKVTGGMHWLENVFLVVCAAIFMLLMFLCAGDVIGRYAFNRPITGTYEISEVMMGAIVLLGWAYTQRTGGHVTVDMFYEKFPSRARGIISLLVLIISLALFAVITFKSWNIAMANTIDGREFKTIAIPSGPPYFLVPLGGFFMCLEIIVGLLQLFKKGLKG